MRSKLLSWNIITLMPLTVWFLAGNGGMRYWDYYWGLYRGYYTDPFPHSLLSTRHKNTGRLWERFPNSGA